MEIMNSPSPLDKDDGDQFTWGETAIVSDDAPVSLRPGSTCSVVGFTRVDGSAATARYPYPAGTVMCLVEYADGTDAEVPEFLLKRPPKHTGDIG
jgi:hypothetical protein